MARLEIFIIVVLAFVPLFLRLPYRVNIFLSWEGAYRISQGQLPFRDFGTPLGGMYWVIPAIFFKLLGPGMFTLVKAQVFINILAGLSFRSILRTLSDNAGIRLASVLLFCLSYSFFNFWPWYNHSVIVYELAALACLFRWVRPDLSEAAAGTRGRWRIGWLAAAGAFTVFSFLTKQDGGGLTFFICSALLLVYGLIGGGWKGLPVYVVSFIAVLLLMILPFLSHGFGYWFNHGQAPHTARVSAYDIAEDFFGGSQWIKFYLFFLVVLCLACFRDAAVMRREKRLVLLVVLTLGILGEAAIFQVTSYTPPDNNIFYHSFAFACLFTLAARLIGINFGTTRMVVVLAAGILLWWSGVWWKYTNRLVARIVPPRSQQNVSPTGENVVNKYTYTISRDTVRDIPVEQWIECGLPAFNRIYMPAPTVAGIHRLMEMDIVKRARLDAKESIRVLNMSELTPLAAEIPFSLERNSELPLWYHLGVGMFNRQAEIFEKRIGEHYYDLVLFEDIPTLNNFYAFRVGDSLRRHYRLVDSFVAPRRGPETQGKILVYVRPADGVAVAGDLRRP
jgi:hypothetical protein